MKYQTGNWAISNPMLGLFDLIIGSDVLYERQQPSQLAAFITLHAAPNAQIVIVDPDRGNRVDFCNAMFNLGFSVTAERANRCLENGDRYKGRILSFSATLPKI